MAIRDATIEPAPFADAISYRVPERYLLARADVAGVDELWKPVWRSTWRAQTVEISILVGALIALTVALLRIPSLMQRSRLHEIFRIGFLLSTLGWVGWSTGAQMTILRWLCPFGALQELTARAARFLGVQPLRLSYASHRWLWPIKYGLLLGLVGLAIYSFEAALGASEIEPFETAIVLGRSRDWPYLVYAGCLLGAGIVVERFYCRFLCPLGAVMALGGRARRLAWLDRHSQCGRPCQLCERRCPVQAIEPDGKINMTECLDCQVLYRDELGCPAHAAPRSGGTPDRGAPPVRKAS